MDSIQEWYVYRCEEGGRIMFYLCNCCTFENSQRSQLNAHLKTKKHKVAFEKYKKYMEEQFEEDKKKKNGN